MGKHSIFQSNKVKNSKILKVGGLREIFQFSSGNNFWYIHASELKFFKSFTTKLGKMKILHLGAFFTNLTV